MGFKENTGQTETQLIKEEAEDYRYIPEQDLRPVHVSREWVKQIEATLPELPDAKRERFIAELGLPAVDAGVLVADKAVADYYESAVAASIAVTVGKKGEPAVEAKTIANWITGEMFK